VIEKENEDEEHKRTFGVDPRAAAFANIEKDRFKCSRIENVLRNQRPYKQDCHSGNAYH